MSASLISERQTWATAAESYRDFKRDDCTSSSDEEDEARDCVDETEALVNFQLAPDLIARRRRNSSIMSATSNRPKLEIDSTNDPQSVAISSIVEAINSLNKSIDQHKDMFAADVSLREQLRRLQVQGCRTRSLLSEAASKPDRLALVNDLLNGGTMVRPEEAAVYRAVAAKEQAAFNFTVPDPTWLYPEYFSTLPIAEFKEINATFFLPTGMKFPLTLSGQEKCDDVIRRLVSVFAVEEKLDAKYPDDNTNFQSPRYVMKAVGMNEYLVTGSFVSHEYVRQCIHDSLPISIKLVPTPKSAVVQDEDALDILTKRYKELAALGQNALEEKENELSAYKASINFEKARRRSTVFSAEDRKQFENKHGTEPPKRHIQLTDLAFPFRVEILGLDHCSSELFPRMDPNKHTHLMFEIFVFHGMSQVPNGSFSTRLMPVHQAPRWYQWLQGSIGSCLHYKDIPRESRLGCVLNGVTATGKKDRLAWVATQLIDSRNHLKQGVQSLRMWPLEAKSKKLKELEKQERDDRKNSKLSEDEIFSWTTDLSFVYRGANVDNRSDSPAAVLTIKFNTFNDPVYAPLQDPIVKPNPRELGPSTAIRSLDKNMKSQLLHLGQVDILHELSPSDKYLLWQVREDILNQPKLLPFFLQSVDWTKPHHRQEARRLLHLWTPPEHYIDFFFLLGPHFPDYEVRAYAVAGIEKMNLPPNILQLYLLQLTQCLKAEPYHISPLSRFLVKSALQHPYQLGHYFFWHLKAELHNPAHSEKFRLILEEYLFYCGRGQFNGLTAEELHKQYVICKALQVIAERVTHQVNETDMLEDEILSQFFDSLEDLNKNLLTQVGSFKIPLNPKLEATTLRIAKCRYMTSKKVPLMLYFENADPDVDDPIIILFKSGDDLRQDILTLQILRYMDQIWQSEGLDLRLKPYGCVATGVNAELEGVGMIECVTPSKTTAGIAYEYGGGAIGVFKQEPIRDFLKDKNQTPEQYEHAKANFIRSCAGYCVATYCMGIGDRHNDNIMVTEMGHLFHIDFGHFLGNFKSKHGYKRERTKFVFTPPMAFVIGGKDIKNSAEYKRFQELCFRAFHCIRKRASHIETLFVLMTAAQMPELIHENNVTYLREMLLLDKSEREANKIFKDEIRSARKALSRTLDNWVHVLKQKGFF